MRRLLPSLLVALVGLAIALNAVHAAKMETDMVMAAHGTGAPPCDGCAHGVAGCAAMCALAFALPSSPSCPIDLSVEAHPAPVFHWAEQPSGPPDPHPPRAA